MYRRQGFFLVVAFVACCALLNIYSTMLYDQDRRIVESQVTGELFINVDLILFAESLQKHGFNCSDTDDWNHMRSLILSKSGAAVNYSTPDLSYMMCVANNHKQCKEEHVSVAMVQRKCHLFSHMRFLPGNQTAYKRYVLASTPGAGIKWMRLILEELTGIFTGSSYCDSWQLFSGFFGESVTSSRVLAVATYGMNYSLSEYDSVVYIIRNPYHIIVSKLTKRYSSVDADTELITTVNDDDLEEGLQEWTASIESWLVHTDKPIHVVSYDQLLATTEAELLRLMEFLDYPISAKTLNCVVQSYSNFFRYDRFGSRNPYTNEQRNRIQEAILKYKEVWQAHRVSFHWTWEM